MSVSIHVVDIGLRERLTLTVACVPRIGETVILPIGDETGMQRRVRDVVHSPASDDMRTGKLIPAKVTVYTEEAL